MAASTITITFTADLVIGNRLIFNIQTNPSTYPLNWYQNYQWVNLRSSSSQVTTGTPISGSLGERAAINFKQAFELDNAMFINSGIIQVTRTVNQIVITAPNTNTFVLFNLTNIVPGTSTHPSINIAIVDGSFNPFKVNSAVFSQADSAPCQNVKLTVQTSVLATKILSPVSVDPNSDNPITLNLLRGTNPISLTLKDANNNTINELIEVPAILNPNDFQLQINNSPNGASVIANYNGLVPTSFLLLSLEFSLDNSTWQTSNVFSGLIPDDYTLYIKDQFGCSVSIDFTVNEVGIYTSYFYISKANSIRFANRVDFGDAANYKNDENTLSCEADVILPYKEVLLFQTADVITTQFKSNYSLNEVKVIRENGSEVIVPVVKKSNFIGNKDLRDARKYDLGGGKTAIYFTTGNIYDFDTGTDTGDDHYLNGSLPKWAKSGNYIKVDTEWFLIEDILFDESKNAEIIIISNNYTGVDVSVIAGAIYNIFDFEIYEFVIDMVDYIDETIKVKIVASDDNFTTVTHLSEDISVKVKHEHTKNVNYWNNDNNDIFYATGIRHNIRIPYHRRSGISEETSETHKTDTTTILLNAELYEVDEFKFEPVTKEVWRRNMIALSCKNVIIDGVGYVKNGEFETEGPLEDTNLYVLTAKMIKTGNVFSSQGDGIIDFNTSSEEIPGLISIGNSGFLRYN